MQEANFLLAKLYVPNKVQEWCHFIENLNSTIDDVIKDNEPKIVVGGDFNVTLESDLDCSGGNPAQKASVKSIQDLCLDFDLVNIWRICLTFCVEAKKPIHSKKFRLLANKLCLSRRH